MWAVLPLITVNITCYSDTRAIRLTEWIVIPSVLWRCSLGDIRPVKKSHASSLQQFFLAHPGVISAIWRHDEQKLKVIDPLNGDVSFLPAGCRKAANCRYCFYSQAKNQVFRPAGATRCTDSGQTEQYRRAPGSAWLCKISRQSVQTGRNAAPKISKISTFW